MGYRGGLPVPWKYWRFLVRTGDVVNVMSARIRNAIGGML